VKRLFLPIVLVCSFGCSSDDSPTAADIADDQILVAGREYINWAWGYNHRAKYVDVHGNAYGIAYALNDSIWTLDSSGYYSKEDIDLLIRDAQKQPVNVPKDDVDLMCLLIPIADKGAYSDTTFTGADMGSTITFAFHYESVSDSYKKIILRVEGDFSYHNTSESAKQIDDLISRWLIWGGGLTE